MQTLNNSASTQHCMTCNKQSQTTSNKVHITTPKAVIFDWDNTLVSSKSLFIEALNHALKRLDIEQSILSSDVFLENVHLSARDGFPKIFGDKWLEVQHECNFYMKKKHLERVSLLPHVQDMLDHLTQHNVVLSVVSNKDGQLVRNEADKLRISHYFHSIVGSQDALEDKPSPIPAHFALQKKLPATEFNKDIWFIGDSIADIKCGHNACCLPILFDNKISNWNHVSIPDFAQKNGILYHTIDSHRDLIDLFNRCCRQKK